MLVLTADDVRKALPMQDAIEAMKRRMHLSRTGGLLCRFGRVYPSRRMMD